ncbi:polyketide cyclase / dehydrase and lipid transport family protein [Mycobacterium xenopi 4042]|uniref:Polyketide cyclase / dehydrase and lipid transport family protein n=1 Tax=Mycobacterium xenopi 4042 TaxID=1299334 RepID=X7ZYY3_MYCXE|nr:polyketide cyclase / dehydrase and lipid transport family protein [Mycobacterium xenopi 4042]
MAEKTTQTIYIDADPRTVMDVIADIGSYPEWVSEYKEAEILETDAEGYPKVARFVMDAAVLKDTLVFSYDWPKTAARSAGRWCRVRCSNRSTAHTVWRPTDLALMSPTSSRSIWLSR